MKDNEKPQPAPAAQPASTATVRAGLSSEPVTQAQQAQPPYQQQQPQSGVQVLSSLLRRAPVSLTGYGEAVKKLSNTMRELLKAENPDQDTSFKILVLDQQQHSTALSAVVVTMGVTRGTQQFVAAHTLIVEASAGRLPKLQLNQGQERIELTNTAGDTYTGYMWSKVRDLVATQYANGAVIRDASATTIPTEMDLNDIDRVRKVFAYACHAVYHTLDMLTGNRPDPWSVSRFTRNDRVSAKIDFTPPPVETTTGLPIRADVSITLNASAINTNQADMMPTAGKDFSRVDGYIDLVYCPTQPQYNPMAGVMMSTAQPFQPRFVMTNVVPLVEGINLELMLLALCSATLLSRSRNYAWAGVFRPRYGAELNLRDIGAIGFEVGAINENGMLGKLNTQDSTFTLDRLYQAVVRTCRPDPVYSFDIEETGSLSFLNMIFVAAASGNQEANKMIIDAADRLTDGNFSKHLPANTPIVYDDNNRIHLGYYVSQKGVREDIRNLDYTAVQNLVGAADPKQAILWANTFDRTDIPLEARMFEREQMMDKLIGGNSMRITGYGRRITFIPQAIDMLITAAVQAGLVIQPSNSAYIFGDQVIRGNDAIGQFAYSGNAAAAIFAINNPQISGRGMQSVMGRWGR